MGRPEIGTAAVVVVPDVAGTDCAVAALAATMPKLGSAALAAFTILLAVCDALSPGAAAVPASVRGVVTAAIAWLFAPWDAVLSAGAGVVTPGELGCPNWVVAAAVGLSADGVAFAAAPSVGAADLASADLASADDLVPEEELASEEALASGPVA